MVEIKEDDTVNYQIFDWCFQGKHEECERSFRRHVIDPKKNTVTYLNEVYVCVCTTRGCKCYVKVAERPKKTVRKRK